MVSISWADCQSLVCQAFLQAGVLSQHAERIAHFLVLAEVDGQKGHGLSRVPSYLAQAKSGKVNLHPHFTTSENGAGWFEVNADYGFAYPALDLAFDAAMARIETQGALLVTLRHSHHAGVLGHHVERYADEGLIVLMFANTPAAMAPWGGAKPVFGTNPIAFSCPRVDAPPLVIDLSLSKVARGKIMRAKTEGSSIPDDWALGPDGEPTTDPDTALQGTMLPAGDAKGAALALIVELMSAGLASSHYGFQASSFFDAEGVPPNVAQTLLIIKPQNPSQFSHFEVLFDTILSQDNTRLQGAGRIEKREYARKSGLDILQSDYDFLIQKQPK